MNLKDILNVPNALGDEARKRRLLNIILLGILGFSVIIFVTGVAFLLLAHQANQQEIGDVLLLLGGSIALYQPLVIADEANEAFRNATIK